MLQVRGELDLVEKPLGTEHRGELRVQDLDRDFAAVADVLREVHRRHSSGADLALDRVPLRERRGELVERRWSRHCGSLARTSANQLSTRTIRGDRAPGNCR